MEKNKGRKNNPWNTGQTEKDQKMKNVKAVTGVSEKYNTQNLNDGSSSEDEINERDSMLNNLIKAYNLKGGGSLGKTEQFLKNSFQTGADICLICISSIKRTDPIWNCVQCFGGFHIVCIQMWSKDSIFQRKKILEELPVFQKPQSITWECPKCRHGYGEKEIPNRYWCYCGKVENPDSHPWLVPHSCGDSCEKSLNCNHKCLLLCHPGPCPPCPQIIKTKCFCGKSGPDMKRCHEKLWSCQQSCDKKLICNKHKCKTICHEGQCPPCPQQSQQTCNCGLQTVLRPCSEPRWKCDKVCNKPFSCGHHSCMEVCHSGPCGECPRSLIRSCPCGKSEAVVSCTDEVRPCKDTCGKLMSCGVHHCQLKCHLDNCVCLEIVRKSCRCGAHQKELPCGKEYTCETKCKLTKSCKKHPCNKKCCDGNCPPCEKVCGKTLPCGNHKCQSVCHRGTCFPCPSTVNVYCLCKTNVIVVPCGGERKVKRPACSTYCKNPPDCHHEARLKHKFHYGKCPPCKQICKKQFEDCSHTCPEPCHDVVIVKEEPKGPWEEPIYRTVSFPCPACKVAVMVGCQGSHHEKPFPCSYARNAVWFCEEPCGRPLKCGNHTCSDPCHNPSEACSPCELPCQRLRPSGCAHPCVLPCHSKPCPSPCNELLDVKCHCGLFVHKFPCHVWLASDENRRLEIRSCGNKCPQNYSCGHKCISNCHAGDCPDSDNCRRKVKVNCPCGLVKKEFLCALVQRGEAKVHCDEKCAEQKHKERINKELEDAKRKAEEERKMKEEVEKFERKFQGKKKKRDRRRDVLEDEPSFFSKYWIPISACSVAIFAASVYLIVS